MKTNVKEKRPPVQTHEGAPAARIDAETQLRRSIMACMLWDDSFYESGEEIGARIRALVAQSRPEFAAACAFHARTQMKLRHVPLLIVREMARLPEHKKLVGKLLCDCIQRPDEISEFLSIYWKTNDGKRTVSAQIKKALASAFNKFDEYALAKYNRDGAVKLRDALFIAHSNPRGKGATRYTKAERKEGVTRNLNEREQLFLKLVTGTLDTPDTWEVALSGGADKKETFERLISEKKLGALAFLRNLRNMKEAGISDAVVAGYGGAINLERVLPFRFIAAARAVPAWEPIIEAMMLRSLADAEKLPGKTAVVVDNSGSMHGPKVSQRSDIDRADAARALAILIREISEQSVVIGYGTSAAVIPARRGFALADAIKNGPGGGTNTETAIRLAKQERYDRIIVITDEQSHQAVSGPDGRPGYFINVATYENGIGYGAWTHIDGWSEAVIDYIRAAEVAAC